MHVHTYTYIYIHIHTYTYTYIHLYTYNIHTFTYIYIHTHTYIHTVVAKKHGPFACPKVKLILAPGQSGKPVLATWLLIVGKVRLPG